MKYGIGYWNMTFDSGIMNKEDKIAKIDFLRLWLILADMIYEECQKENKCSYYCSRKRVCINELIITKCFLDLVRWN